MPPKRVAPADEDLVRLYLNDVGRHDLLTNQLAQAIQEGHRAQAELDRHSGRIDPSRQRRLRRLVRHGDRTTDAFITANLRLVVSSPGDTKPRSCPCSTGR